jgi:hypothetical protein
MSEAQRYADPEGRFALEIPRGWMAAPDEEDGGVEVWHEEGVGTLHLMAFETSRDEFPDPAEELYAFLDERSVELEEDEVEDVPLEDGSELALCEFQSEDEEDGEALFWMVGVATTPGTICFATYFCAAGEEARERDSVRLALTTLRLLDRD